MPTILGRYDWQLQRDKDGHRTYKLMWLILADSVTDGPAVILNTPGLPGIGSTWVFGGDNDPWAYCWPDTTVTPVITREPGVYWMLSQTFTTRPLSRCQDSPIENPLLEPPAISGSFTKFTREITKDRHGKAIRTSSQELIRGATVEFDDNRPNVTIEFNTMFLPLSLIAPAVDTVNDAPLWGLDARMIKLSNSRWQRLLYGTCNYFYRVGYEFDINYKTFDRRTIDEGSRVLLGWAPGSGSPPMDPDAPDATNGNKANYLNPKNYEVYKDINGENTRVILDGKGRPLADGDEPVEIEISHYEESNFLLLGVPPSLT